MHNWNETTHLTPREHEILVLLASGKTTIETAERLGLRPSAINDHLRSACGKTGAQNAVHAARLYREHRSQPLAA